MYRLLLGAFALSLFTQGVLWRLDLLTDEHLWVDRVDLFTQELRTLNFDPDDTRYSGHPGTSILTIGGLSALAGLHPRPALYGSVALLTSAGIALAIILFRRLFPFWWIASSMLLMWHPGYTYASPTNIVAAVWILVAILSFWNQWILLAGFATGLGMATRLPSTVLMLMPFVAWIVWQKGRKDFLRYSLATALSLFLFDPFLIFSPLDHIGFVLFRSNLNYTEIIGRTGLSYSDFLLFAPLSMAGFFLGIVYLIQNKSSSSRVFVLLCLLSTFFLGIALSQVQAPSLRHWLPVLILWEVLFPWLFSPFFQMVRESRRTALTRVFFVIISLSNLFLLIHVLMV